MELSQQELQERVTLIESMMQEGRRTTEHWGWMFLLWGIGYLVAIGWSMWLPYGNAAWPVTMIATALIGIAIGSVKGRRKMKTARSRALGGIWTAAGCAIFVFTFPVAFSGHMEPHSFLAAIEVMIGLANVASSMALRWKVQFAMGLLWWAAAVATCYANGRAIILLLVGVNLIGNVGFGIYLMMLEARAKGRLGTAQVSHA